ncbi:hypothetical protein GGX14DRAFT_633779 [Mycena pura]|uniref:Uncharacterized protein n=1 Tax=Mycena pura TaxID=153505 RepID=A0AAD6VDI0_9AGAR|nr:hypothetical protein GGX14DRAFT_633779 [Mycena pura]
MAGLPVIEHASAARARHPVFTRAASSIVKILLYRVFKLFARMLKSAKALARSVRLRWSWNAHVISKYVHKDCEGEGDDEDGEGTDAEAKKEVAFFFDRDIDPNSAALRDLLALESEEPEPEMSQKEKHKSVEVKKTTTAELDWSQIRRGGSKS